MSDKQIWVQQCLNLQTAMLIYHGSSLGCGAGIVDGRETWFELRFMKFVQLMNYVVFDEVWKVRNKTLKVFCGLSNLESDILCTYLTECCLEKFSIIFWTDLKNLPPIHVPICA